MNLDWRWRQMPEGQIPDGKRLLLKMADKDGRITYAIGIYDGKTGKFRYTAQEDPNVTLPVFWMAFPE